MSVHTHAYHFPLYKRGTKSGLLTITKKIYRMAQNFDGGKY